MDGIFSLVNSLEQLEVHLALQRGTMWDNCLNDLIGNANTIV
jgi:hypothetical protein